MLAAILLARAGRNLCQRASSHSARSRSQVHGPLAGIFEI